MKILQIFTNAFSAGLLCVVSFHLAVGDVLLFSSDFASLSVYLGAAGILIGLIFAVALLLSAFLPGGLHRCSFFAPALLASFCVVGFLAAASSMIYPALRVFGLSDWLTRIAQTVDGPWLVAPAGLVSVLAAGWFYRVSLRMIDSQPDMAPRINRLGLIVFSTGVLAVGFAHFSAPSADLTEESDGPPQHLVLLVIDRMPSWAIQSYNVDAVPTAFDLGLKDHVRVFHNMQTSQPYTHGFFGTLYRGRLPGDPSSDSLLRRLSKHGVDIHLIYGHRAASPEGSAAQVSNYNGLRSRLLGPGSAIVPKFLGLQRHLALVPPRPNEGILLAPLWKVFNPGYPHVDLLNEVLLPSVEVAITKSRNSFTLFHVSLSRFNAASYAERSPQFAAKGEDPVITSARNNGYRYTSSPHADAVMQQYYEFAAEDVRHFADQFQSFFGKLNAEFADRNVSVIVTSDHGSIYDKGRVFYGYHSEREVVRVPFLSFGEQGPAHDRRLFGTMDLSNSILDYFEAEKPPLADNVVSFFREDASDGVASLTLKSDHQKEWFLMLYRGSEVFRMNIHPATDFEVKALHYDQFDETEASISEDTRDDLLAQARYWLKRFHIDLQKTNLPVQ